MEAVGVSLPTPAVTVTARGVVTDPGAVWALAKASKLFDAEFSTLAN